MYIPDPIEQMEAAAERSFDRLEPSNDGTCQCCICGERCDLELMGPSSPNPYSMPACPKCLYGENEAAQ